MQFRVPQFIDMEDKIIGPLTLRQFGYILGAAGLSFLIWTFVPVGFIAILLIIPVAGLFLALAFLKINNRSFGEILESAFSYYTGVKIYTWKQPEGKTATTQQPIEKVIAETSKEVAIARVSKDKLHDIALGLDVFDNQKQDAE